MWLKRIVIIVLLGLPMNVEAGPLGYTMDLIYGEHNTRGIKLAYHYNSKFLRRYVDKLDVYFETSINFWEYGRSNKHDTNFVISVSPIIHYPLMQIGGRQVFLEFGIGASLLDDVHFAGNDVSTHYQFEDRLGLLAHFGKSSLGVRWLHYSNAGIKRPNPGLDFFSLSYTRRF